MEGKKGIERIIRHAPLKMREMLKSVYQYNSSFSNDNLLEKILFAMYIIDRKFFYGFDIAYTDNALPIGKGQTISQPSTVARMLLLAELKEGDEVLEVGAGSGWNACLIAFLVYPGNIVSIDRVESLLEKAQENIKKLRNHLKLQKSLQIKISDSAQKQKFLTQTKPQDVEKITKINFIVENVFSKGDIWKKKYDKIILTAGIADKKTEEKIQELAKNLLKKNGLLICPYTSGPLIIYRKKEKLERKETKEGYVFVPLLEGMEK